jgi:hypothetical protein
VVLRGGLELQRDVGSEGCECKAVLGVGQACHRSGKVVHCWGELLVWQIPGAQKVADGAMLRSRRVFHGLSRVPKSITTCPRCRSTFRIGLPDHGSI